jgi:hypothetical protein
MAAPRDQRPVVLAVLAAVAGAVVALVLVLGLLTFAVQATVHPHGVPLAVALADAPPQLKAVGDALGGQPRHERRPVAWRC